MAPINILSLNVQGFNIPHKRTKAMRSFSAKKAHIICLQETHFTDKATPKFLSPSYPQFYTASTTVKQRGTLIGFHRSMPFTLLTQLKDPEGRYLLLAGYILDMAVTIVSYYAPNKRPESFLSHLFQIVETHKFGTVVLCGDSNTTVFPFLDKSPPAPVNRSTNVTLQHLLTKHGLVDTWRELNPTSRRFTHYSYPHKSFSRIDHILIPYSMTPEILSSNIIPYTWTDHCAICTSIASTLPRSHDTNWCINDSTLTHPSHRSEIEIALKDYFSSNDTGDTSDTTLWEAHKVVIRGRLIQQATNLKRERKLLFAKLEDNFNSCHSAFQSYPNAINNTK